MAGGAAIIDIKEPRNGSLGAAGPRVIAEIAHQLSGTILLSVALGELLEWSENAKTPEIPAGPCKATSSKTRSTSPLSSIPTAPSRSRPAWVRSVCATSGRRAS